MAFKAWFNLIHVTHVETKVSSLRYYIAKKQSSWEIKTDIIKNYKKQASNADIKNLFLNFKSNIINIRHDLHKEFEKFKGKKNVGYGASATSKTMISQFELYNYIDFLVDDNNVKPILSVLAFIYEY